MRLTHSHDQEPLPSQPHIASAMASITQAELQRTVEVVAIPRHYLAEPAGNRRVCNWIEGELQELGYSVVRQSPWHNLVTASAEPSKQMAVLIGCHYDSVPQCPGADDNASAIAVSLAVARALAQFERREAATFVFFNREEEPDMPGSAAYVEELAAPAGETHILEMVGFRSHEADSQAVPPDLPITLSDRGDFLALLAADQANPLVSVLHGLARTYADDLPVVALELELGAGTLSRHLFRSDHVAFWRAGYPAIMWTDTSNFRNPHYHLASDCPETLDYGFMEQVAALLLARVLHVHNSAPAT